MYYRTILCLANSRKPPSGRCIAGKEYQGARTGQWIRPVSSRSSHEVSEDERRYESGSKAQILDIIRIPLLEHSPQGHQSENHVLDEDSYWEKQGEATWEQIVALEDSYDKGFWVAAEDTHYGLNDKISEAVAVTIPSSLKLLVLKNLSIEVQREQGFQGRPGRRRVRTRFRYASKTYLLSLTDPEIEEQYLRQGDGIYEIGKAAVCISLGEVWNAYAFRLVASVITPERCGA